MATSWVEICNLALTALGSQPITAFPPTDQSQTAKLAQACYQMLADEVLAEHDWGCAEERQELSALATPPDDPLWSCQFQLPVAPKCLRVRGISPEADYVRSGSRILTNEPSIVLIYTAQITDPTLLDPHVAAALGARIAVHLAPKIAQDMQLTEALRQAYERALARAMWADEKNKKRVTDGLPTTNMLTDLRLEEIG